MSTTKMIPNGNIKIPPHKRVKKLLGANAEEAEEENEQLLGSTTTGKTTDKQGLLSTVVSIPNLVNSSSSKRKQPETTPVNTKMGFVAISDIDTVTNTVRVKFYLDMWWKDPAYIGCPKGALPENAWVPDAYIMNAIEREMDHKAQGANLMDSATGLCLNAIEYEGLITINMSDLSDFPFDEHPLLIHVHQSEKQSRDEFVFRPHEPEDEACRLFYRPDVGDEFELRGFSWDPFEVVGGNDVEYCSLQLLFCATRRPWYYLLKIVFPLFLCTIFCFSAMFFPIDDLPSRMSVVTTMFLATSALMYVLSSNLPRTARQTVIDKYLISTLILQLFVGIESWIVYESFGTFPLDTRIQFDGVAKWVLPGLFIASTVYQFVPATLKYVFVTPHRPPRYLKALNKKYMGGSFHRFVEMKNVFPDDSRLMLPTLLNDNYFNRDKLHQL